EDFRVENSGVIVGSRRALRQHRKIRSEPVFVRPVKKRIESAAASNFCQSRIRRRRSLRQETRQTRVGLREETRGFEPVFLSGSQRPFRHHAWFTWRCGSTRWVTLRLQLGIFQSWKLVLIIAV